jgi:hypothetical protein
VSFTPITTYIVHKIPSPKLCSSKTLSSAKDITKYFFIFVNAHPTLPKMHTTTLFCVFIISAPFILSQHIFINLVPEYSALPSCAQSPLSSIVRDMDKGCGDGGATTSYSCFCTASSSYFSTLISTVVLMQCLESGQASSAVDVFDSYCAVGGVASQQHPTIATATGTLILLEL